MTRTFLATTAMLLFVTTAEAGVREDVDAIAQLIEDNYYDVDKAKSIATDLRQRAQQGKFSTGSDPRDLAAELSEFLYPFDHHFRVTYEPKAPDTDGSRKPQPRVDVATRRANYGFRRAERLPGNIGLIEVTQVADIEFKDANDPARRAADAALALMKGSDAVIIDLRNNGGGAPSMVGYLVSAFVKPDANVYNTFHSRDGTETEKPDVTYPQPDVDVPLYVLTSARTGSAAESIAFTLQSCGRAKVVGERSGGAANPGEPFRTKGGYEVFISWGSPRNPLNGRNWEGEGVRPDVEVAAALALDRASSVALDDVLQGAKLTEEERTDAQWVKEALGARAKPFVPKSLTDFAGTYGRFAIAIEAGVLKASTGRRPASTLVPLREDVFFDQQDPARRFVFERENSQVVTMTIRMSSGEERRFRKTRGN